jgi:hypothetical protein
LATRFPKLAKLAIVDDDECEQLLRPPSNPAARLAGAAYLRRKEEERMWTEIYGYDIRKSEEYFDNPALQDDTQARQSSSVTHLPRPVRDIRRPACSCSCENCKRQDCGNCCAEDRCPQSGEGLRSEIVDIGEAVREIFRQAARDRARQSKLDQHKKALRPMVHAFRNEFPYRSVKIDEAVDRVVDAAAGYVADVTATV